MSEEKRESPGGERGGAAGSVGERGGRTSERVASVRQGASIVVSCGIGLIVGLLIGMNIGGAPTTQPGPEVAASDGAAAITSGPSEEAPPPGRARVAQMVASGLHLDLGDSRAQGLLEGAWSRQAEVDGRAVAIATGASAQVVIPVAAEHKPRTLAVVARATGIDTGKLHVNVTVGREGIASWALGSTWAVYTAPMPAPWPGEKRAIVSFAVDTPARGNDEGAAGMAVDHLQVVELSETAGVDLDTPDGRSRLLAGFYGVEGVGQGRPWVWSRGRRSRIALLLKPTADDYVLEISAYWFPPISPVALDVRVNGAPVGQVELGEEREYVLQVPSGILVRGANTIELAYSKTGRPIDHQQGTTDTRELAMQVFELKLMPAQRRGPGAP